MFRRLVVMGLLLLTGLPARAQGTSPVVAWVADGRLYLWQPIEAAPVVLADNPALQPYLSPDAVTVVYTAGADGLPESLWTVDTDGEPRQLVSSAAIEGALIDQIAWADAHTVYFNTSEFAPPLGVYPRDDLYRVQVDAADAEQVLPVGEGGAFAIGPSGEQIALIRAGRFDEAGGVATFGDIRLFSLADGTTEMLHTFDPVTTGSHTGYYPQVAWIDATTLLAAIPLTLFDLSGAVAVDTPLWQMSTDGRTQVSAVSVDFGYSLAWSAGGEALYYAQTTDAPQVFIADADGDNPQAVARGNTSGFVWAQAGSAYAYVQAEQAVVVGTRDRVGTAIIEVETGQVGGLTLLDANTLLYLTWVDGTFSLHLATLTAGQADTQTLFSTNSPNGIVYDARMP